MAGGSGRLKEAADGGQGHSLAAMLSGKIEAEQTGDVMSGTLRIGFFEGFLSQDTLLLSGDAEAMNRLAELFHFLATTEVSCRLESLPFVQAYQKVTVLAERSSVSSGLRFSGVASGWLWSDLPRRAGDFQWRLSAEDWDDLAWRVAALAGSGAGHQYITYLGVVDYVQVIVSVNEYDERWWQQHG
jgi:hypothetical protein